MISTRAKNLFHAQEILKTQSPGMASASMKITQFVRDNKVKALTAGTITAGAGAMLYRRRGHMHISQRPDHSIPVAPTSHGYQGGSSAYIQMNGSGYDNPSSKLAQNGMRLGSVRNSRHFGFLNRPPMTGSNRRFIDDRRPSSQVTSDQNLSRMF